MKYLLISFLMLAFAGCQSGKQPAREKNSITVQPLRLTRQEAEKLVKLPLKCIHKEYPNKPGEVLASAKDLKSPRAMHPCFYGCFDWHSAVHGHWSLVKLLKEYPGLKEADTLKRLLKEQISKENIRKEAAYFKPELNHLYERTYGWAWLLKLAAELHTWHTPLAQRLEQNLQPLTRTIVDLYKNYLPRLRYPIRVGTHTNTAFGLSFAMDYAKTVHDTAFEKLIARRARDFFLADSAYPLRWEPSGYDFLSPGMEEVDIMRKVLPETEFKSWLKKFLPQLTDKNFTWAPGVASDRKDGTMVHLDGLNFSRAWCLYGLAKQYPEFSYLVPVANTQMKFSLPNLMGDSYMGGHWLASFAINALTQ